MKSRIKQRDTGISRYLSAFIMLGLDYSRSWVGFLFATSVMLAEASTKSASLAFWSDQYEPYKDNEGFGGFAGLYTLCHQLPADTILLSGGDLIAPNPYFEKDYGRHRIDVLNRFNLTAFTMGNHELDAGTENAKTRMQESNFPWLAANAVDSEGKYFTGERQTVVVKRNGMNVGVFGLMSEATPQEVKLNNNITFTSAILTARKMVEELKQQKADIIIALTHMHTYEDQHLAREVPEINAILGGHDHSKAAMYIGNTLLIKPGQDAHDLALVNCEVLESGSGVSRSAATCSSEFLPNQNVLEDVEMLSLVNKHLAILGEQSEVDESSAPIARMDRDCDTLEENLRAGRSEFATLIAESLRVYGQADVGFLSGGCIRNKRIYKKGDLLSYQDIREELKFPDKFTLVEISGEMLLAALENGVSKMPAKDGRFPQFSGMIFDFDDRQPGGKRVIQGSVYIQGKPLDIAKNYKVATANFIVDGDVGNYSMFKAARVIIPYSEKLLIRDVFADYVANKPSMKIEREVCETSSALSQENCAPTSQYAAAGLRFFAAPKHDEPEQPLSQRVYGL